MEFPAITAAISAVKNISELISGLSSLSAKKESLELTRILSSLLSQLIEIQHYVLKLESDKIELNNKISQISDWFDKTEPNYKLVALADGVYAYTQREPLESENGQSDPPHFLCPRCFGNRRKSILQSFGYNQNGRIYKCLECGSEICDHAAMPSQRILSRPSVSSGLLKGY